MYLFADITSKLETKFVDISVLVPLTLDRVSNSIRLLKYIKNGTKLPKEIIFSLSGTNAIPEELKEFQKDDVNFKIILSNNKKNAAENRNIAASKATMPIFAFLDSDDISGPQWLESLDYYYQTTNASAILHKWFPCSKGIPTYGKNFTNSQIVNLNEIFPAQLSDRDAFDWACCPKKMENNLIFDKGWTHPWFAHGHISVRREIMDEIKQRENKVGQEDSWFVGDILQKGYKTIVLEHELTGYCKY